MRFGGPPGHVLRVLIQVFLQVAFRVYFKSMHVNGLSGLAIVFAWLPVPTALFSLLYARRLRELAVHPSGRATAWMNLEPVARVLAAERSCWN